jgi:hypothetical protein
MSLATGRETEVARCSRCKRFHTKATVKGRVQNLVKWSVEAHEVGKRLNADEQPLGLQDFAPDMGKGLVIMLYGKLLHRRPTLLHGIDSFRRFPWRR